MDRVGVPMKLHARSRDEAEFGYLDRHFIDDLIVAEDALRALAPKE